MGAKLASAMDLTDLLGGGGLTLVTAQSFTTAAAVNVNSCFSSTYTNYRVEITTTATSATSYGTLRMRASGTDDSSANYHLQVLAVGATSVTAARTTGATSFQTTYMDSGFPHTSQMIDLFSPALAVPTRGQVTTYYRDGAATALQLRGYAYFHDVATAYDGFTFAPGSGTVTGEVRVYGYQTA